MTAFAQVVELDSNIMHSVMMTSSPMLLYWQPATIAIMQAVQDWRAKGIPACYTIDAGPNVHVICEKPYSPQIAQELIKIPGVLDVRTASAGGGAHTWFHPNFDKTYCAWSNETLIYQYYLWDIIRGIKFRVFSPIK